MKKKTGYIKARVKTQEQIQKVYPPAKYWGKPLDSEHLFPSADEVIIPYLGKTVWVKKKRIDLFRFFYEIKDTGGWVVLPDWIDHFNSMDLVPPAGWRDPDHEVDDDTWLEPFEERFIIIDGVLIITG
jgi:hypothetical protein